MKKIAFLTVLLAGGCLTLSPAMAQRTFDYSKVEEKPVDLGHGITAIIPTSDDPAMAIGCTTVAVGTDGIIVVDTQFPALYDKIRAQIATLSPLPVKYVINTHAHGDHTGGNADFSKDGAIIVAHENVLKAMSNPPPGANGQPGTPVPKMAWPVQTYSGQGTEVKLSGQRAELVHVEHAHTDGDTIIFFPDADVIATGDTMHKPGYPSVDAPGSGNSTDGMIAAATFIVDHSDAKTKIVPGHGQVTDKAGAIAFRNMLVTAKSRLAKDIAKGMTEEQVIAANPLADLDKAWLIKGNGASGRFLVNYYRLVKSEMQKP
ncbi:MAG: MBL fold metallo-hydrolase [Solirubrobacteraceae bacterium]|jgi:glyoxylase-like metal-dependent hydrolase (beta-lactamase superfamily II)